MQAIEALGRKAIFWQADVSDRRAVSRMFEGVIAEFGRIDIVVSNAAFSIRELVIEAEWENVPQHTGGYTIRSLPCVSGSSTVYGQARTKRTQSWQGLSLLVPYNQKSAAPKSAAYNMAKAAINQFGQTLAAELVQYRINVNMINTRLDRHTPGERTFYTEEEIQAGGKALPWGRLGNTARYR